MPDQSTYQGKPSDPDSVKFKTHFQGIPISVDRPKGFRMSGITEKGDPWTREYKYDYGFIPKTDGGDGDGIDVFIGPDKTDEETYWAFQTKEDGSFDEYKVFLGFGSIGAATEAYAAHIPKRLLKSMVTLKIDMVKAMLGIEALGFSKTAGLIQVSFFDELVKIGVATKQAGVGWDVHGYSGDPQDFPVDLGKGPERKYEGGSQPGFFGRLLGRKPVQGKLIVTPELAAWQKLHAEDDGRYERTRALRIQTPFDRQTSYKANDQLAGNFAPDLWEHTTDFAYGAKPVEKRLSREDLTKVIDTYQQAASKWQPKGEDNMAQYSKAFVQKAQHLLKDPKFQFARLEYE